MRKDFWCTPWATYGECLERYRDTGSVGLDDRCQTTVPRLTKGRSVSQLVWEEKSDDELCENIGG